ncbi:hypothetical protein Droror1_Dr00026224 [Drosera rotundifolia]
MLLQMRSLKLHFLLSVWRVSSPLQQIQVRGFRIPGTYPRVHCCDRMEREYLAMLEAVGVVVMLQLKSSSDFNCVDFITDCKELADVFNSLQFLPQMDIRVSDSRCDEEKSCEIPLRMEGKSGEDEENNSRCDEGKTR